LLDERAALATMTYVDLNPVRAGMAATPEGLDYTSIQVRLWGAAAAPWAPMPRQGPAVATEPKPISAKEAAVQASETATSQPPTPLPQAPLMPFDATARTPWAVPFGWHDYAELVDWTGRQVHPHKKGYLAAQTPALLERLCARRQTRSLRGMRTARHVFERGEQC